MDFKYYNYISNVHDYYSPPSKIKKFEYNIEIPENWRLIEGSHWNNVIYQKGIFIDQGWKIHISCNIEQAQEILAVVSNYMFEIKTSFKYVKNKVEWINKNSKSAAREYSGKFITIYPRQEELLTVLEKLENILGKYEKGPYILTDRRWKNTNIYYRYGGFVNIILEDGRLAIKDNSGNLVEDSRLPFYQTPEWVKVPQFIIENEKEEVLETELDKYEIKSALHFSNSGGVYDAYLEKYGRVVIKEARPHAGLDGMLNDATYRLNKEYKTLVKLSSLDYVPKVYEYFRAWEHDFLVLEYVEGENLSSWIAKNYPFSEKENLSDYVETLAKIAEKCCEALSNIHKLGITHGDIQPRNIIVNFSKDDVNVKFIDLETSGIVGEKGDKSLGTPGYFNSFDDYSDEKDWTGLFRIFKTALLTVTSLEMIVENCYDIQYRWINKTFGKKATDILEKILEYTKDKNYDLTVLKNKNYKLLEKVEASLLPNRAKNSLMSRLNFDSVSLLHGDIKQFEYSFGDISVAYGAAGAVLVLDRLGEKLDLENWYEKLDARINLDEKPMRVEDYGLYSGLSGVATTLRELNNEYLSKKIFENIIKNIDVIIKTKNISLESGISGIGLALLDYYVYNKDKIVLLSIQKICDKLNNIFKKKPEDIYTSNDAVSSDGLMYGWSGAAMFLFGCYNILKKDSYLERAKEYLLFEMNKLEYKDNMLLLPTKDHKMMPYFSVGSSGLAIPIILMSKYLEKAKVTSFIENIMETLRAKPCVCGGLFEGYIGLKYIENVILNYLNKNDEIVLDYDLNQYIVEDKMGILNFPGNYSFRVSEDLATGLLGLLVYLKQDTLKNYLWVPIKNQDSIFRV